MLTVHQLATVLQFGQFTTARRMPDGRVVLGEDWAEKIEYLHRLLLEAEANQATGAVAAGARTDGVRSPHVP